MDATGNKQASIARDDSEAGAWQLLSQPCPSCPWQTDRFAKDIPHFDLQLARNLIETCPDAKGHGPAFGSPLFACHQTQTGQERPCAGWLGTVGHHHPNVRLAVLRGQLREEALTPSPDWPQLHDSYADVLRKLEASSD